MNLENYKITPELQQQIDNLITKENTKEEVLNKITEILFNKIPFEKVKEECQPLVHTFSCRCVTGPSNPFVYRCKTCQTSSTSCICVDCFKNGNHEGHEYYLQSLDGGGTCDCGTKSWNKEGWCKNHGKEFTGNAFELIPEQYKITFISVTKYLLEKLIELFNKINKVFIEKKECDVLPNEAILVSYIVNVFNKLVDVDLFFIVLETIFSSVKGEYISIISHKYKEITAMQYLFECAFIESEIYKEDMNQLMLTMVTNEKTTDLCYGYFFDMLIEHGKRRLNKFYEKQKFAFSCQLFADD